MADAGTTGAPAAQVPEPTGTNGTPQASKGQPTAAQIAKWKADLGEGEQEYDPKHLTELAKRGKKAAQTLSLAERRAQEAQQRHAEAEAREADFKSGDPKRIRAALKRMGVDERTLANEVGRDLLEDMEAEKDPTRKALRESQRKLQQLEEERQQAKKSEADKALEAETARHQDELATLFTETMSRTGLPKESATAVFHRVAQLYAAVEGTGAQVDPDLAAARVRAAVDAEHRALYWNKGADGKPSLNVEAVKAIFGPDGFDALRRHAVEEYRQKRAAGAQPTAPTPKPQQSEQEPQQKGRGNFWKEIDKRLRT